MAKVETSATLNLGALLLPDYVDAKVDGQWIHDPPPTPDQYKRATDLRPSYRLDPKKAYKAVTMSGASQFENPVINTENFQPTISQVGSSVWSYSLYEA